MRRWLEKQKPYSPQPYEQLAKILTLNGHKYEADEILYASRVRAWRESSAQWPSWLWQLLVYSLIGFGYRTYRLLIWLLALIMGGVLALAISGEGIKHGMMYGVIYSLDMLLPIVRLDERHYTLRLAGWAKYYFYFQKIMGYVLVTALAAGLSGLSKRQK
jgi:small-conductance mechanosensitive channel